MTVSQSCLSLSLSSELRKLVLKFTWKHSLESLRKLRTNSREDELAPLNSNPFTQSSITETVGCWYLNGQADHRKAGERTS